MGTGGFVRVTSVHSICLVKQYRRLLGERKFWATRAHHIQAAPELARLNTAIEALAKVLPLVAPGVVLAELRPLRFHLAVPLPGNALKRAVLAGLRKLGSPNLEELTEYIVADDRIDLSLYSRDRLEERINSVLTSLAK